LVWPELNIVNFRVVGVFNGTSMISGILIMLKSLLFSTFIVFVVLQPINGFFMASIRMLGYPVENGADIVALKNPPVVVISLDE